MARHTAPLEVSLVGEALEGRETTVEEELQVTELSLAQADGRERVALFEELLVLVGVASVQVLKHAIFAVRRVHDWVRLRKGGRVSERMIIFAAKNERVLFEKG